MTAGHSIHGYTPHYAPLEQIQGAGTDGRSDLYSLAATLYHLMTGFTPADAFSRAAVVVTGQPDPLRPPSELNPQVPQSVADVLMQVMSQNRDQRPARASEMRRMLREAAVKEQPTVVPPAEPRTDATIVLISERQKDNDSTIINRPSPAAGNLSTHKKHADNLVSRVVWDGDQPERATSPRPAPAIEPTPLIHRARKRNPLSWMTLGIVAPMIIGIVVFAVVTNRRSNTTGNDIGVTGLATPSNAKPAEPTMKSFDFDTVTVDAKGNIADHRKGQARYYVEDIGGALEMVEIPGGTFHMGITPWEAILAGKDIVGMPPEIMSEYSRREVPQHTVSVPTFYMGKYEVTRGQWGAVSRLPRIERDLVSDPSTFKGDSLPVEQVSWEDAIEFCARLSRATGRTYRLPTEAEWEYCCRGGTTTKFYFGATITPELVNYNGNYPYPSAAKGTYRQATTAAGSVGYPNAFGLSDMHGNVWEWCMDYWHESYKGAPTDGSSWESAGDASRRVLRGGSWGTAAFACRSAVRDTYPPGFRDSTVGFRVVVGVRTP